MVFHRGYKIPSRKGSITTKTYKGLPVISKETLKSNLINKIVLWYNLGYNNYSDYGFVYHNSRKGSANTDMRKCVQSSLIELNIMVKRGYRE